MYRIGVAVVVFAMLASHGMRPARGWTGSRPCPPAEASTPDDSEAAAAAEPEAILAPPSNVSFRKDLRPIVARLLQRSPTFRKQLQRIREAGNLQVTIQLVTSQSELPYHARCIVDRRGSFIRVKMEIVALSAYPNVIGHEFEHLLEQLEGLNLRALAAKRGSGVVRQPDGSYETNRAIAAGDAVAREYLSFGRAR